MPSIPAPRPGGSVGELYAWERSPALPASEEETVALCPEPRFTVYVWDSARLLDQFENSPNLFADLSGRHINRLLVSYTADQIDAQGTRGYGERWRILMAAAHRHGLRVELLLGEPRWILPEHRNALLDIVQRMTTLPFQGIHLDLEPNQLAQTGQSEAYLLDQLLQSIRAVKAFSRLPLGLSIHYRYLDPARPDGGLGGDLTAIGVAEVSLMIYNADPDRVARIAAPIIRRFPELGFSIAQSVEPILSPEESYATRSLVEFWGQMRRLQSELRHPNFQSILIQSWTDYEEMQP